MRFLGKIGALAGAAGMVGIPGPLPRGVGGYGVNGGKRRYGFFPHQSEREKSRRLTQVVTGQLEMAGSQEVRESVRGKFAIAARAA